MSSFPAFISKGFDVNINNLLNCTTVLLNSHNWPARSKNLAIKVNELDWCFYIERIWRKYIWLIIKQSNTLISNIHRAAVDTECQEFDLSVKCLYKQALTLMLRLHGCHGDRPQHSESLADSDPAKQARSSKTIIVITEITWKPGPVWILCLRTVATAAS